jgi:hypothetical protein
MSSDIVPAKGTDKYKIGMKFSDIDSDSLSISSIEVRGNLSVYKTECIWFFVFKESGTIGQICFFEGYKGKVLGKVGVGGTLDCVHRHYGKCDVSDGVHEPINLPGIGFEFKAGNKSGSAVVETVTVMDHAYSFLFNVPEHMRVPIQRQGKRKLP